MATLDISRNAFNPAKHLTSVRALQGRVLSDDDWNENERIKAEIERRGLIDIIGAFGSPDDGFKISAVSTAGGLIDFKILAGSIYLGGLRLEMDQAEMFRLQNDWLQMDPTDPLQSPNLKVPAVNVGSPVYSLVYLESWQQALTAIEDRSLTEVALGIADNSGRIRNMRRVHVFNNTTFESCADSWRALKDSFASRKLGVISRRELTTDSKLTVSFLKNGTPDDLCSPSVAGGYLGAENQAIRVQKTSQKSFTWGFDNAAPLYRMQFVDENTIQLLTPPKDQYHWPQTGQVIEVLACASRLVNGERLSAQSGKFRKVKGSYNPDNGTFTLSSPLPPATVAKKEQDLFFLRIWNRGSDIASPEELPFVAGTPVTLGNTGLQVTFTGTLNIAEDYWIIAARPETPNQVVPAELLTGIKPHGVRRFYAPLAIIEWTTDGDIVTGKVIHDCRKKFKPLTEQECCCTYTVGDGITSNGDYNDIQEAIDNLPSEGGKVCVLAGVHDANVLIDGLNKIQVIGCGLQSVVRNKVARMPIFLIRNSSEIFIENLTLATFDGTAIGLEDNLDSDNPPSYQITIRDNRIIAQQFGIAVYVQPTEAGNNRIVIAHNQIGLFDVEEAKVAIFSLADDVLIERNRIVWIPKPKENPDDPQPDGPDTPFDPCGPTEKIRKDLEIFRKIVHHAIRYVNKVVANGIYKSERGRGGIQIGGSSEKVWILQNEIIGGNGDGIILGSLHNNPLQRNLQDTVKDNEKSLYSESLYNILIQENVIMETGGSGIGVWHLDSTKFQTSGTEITDLSIIGNSIRYCVGAFQRDDNDENISIDLPTAGISLAFVNNCIIRENRIEENGRDQRVPICGIYIHSGQKLDLSYNRVINNGPSVTKPILKRVRGGIVIMEAVKLYAEALVTSLAGKEKPDDRWVGAFDAVPAAKIHDNIVTQPLGQALFIFAIGPVSVVSNQFTSLGISAEPLSRIAGAVLIFNAGITRDLGILEGMLASQWSSAKYQAVNEDHFNIETASVSTPVLPNGKIMYSANQVTLDLQRIAESKCISAQVIITLDDLSYVSNQSEIAGRTVASFNDGVFKLRAPVPVRTDLAFVNTILFGPSVRCDDNRFTEGYLSASYSLICLGYMSTAIGNQSTHCLVVPFLRFRRKALNIELNKSNCIDGSDNSLERMLSGPSEGVPDDVISY